MSKPRKHHYLPRFYLRGFSSNARSLIQIEKESGRAAICSINDVASIRDYHRLDVEDVDDPYELERRLSSIEGELATSTRNALEVGIDDLTTHARLVELVSMLRVRIPAMKATIEETLRQVVRSKISNWICLQHMFQLAADEDILRLLLSMKPTLVRAPDGSFFLTGDQPVAVFSPSAKLSRTEGVDITEPDVQLSLPLSQDTLLRLDWENEDPNLTTLTAAEVEEFNRRTVTMATNYVFAPDANKSEACELVKRYRQSSAGMQPPQTLDAGRSALHLLFFRPVVSREQYESAG